MSSIQWTTQDNFSDFSVSAQNCYDYEYVTVTSQNYWKWKWSFSLLQKQKSLNLELLHVQQLLCKCVCCGDNTSLDSICRWDSGADLGTVVGKGEGHETNFLNSYTWVKKSKIRKGVNTARFLLVCWDSDWRQMEGLFLRGLNINWKKSWSSGCILSSHVYFYPFSDSSYIYTLNVRSRSGIAWHLLLHPWSSMSSAKILNKMSTHLHKPILYK